MKQDILLLVLHEVFTKQEVFDIIKKWGPPSVYLIIGLVGKFAIYKKQGQLTKGTFLVTAVLGLISGWIATIACFKMNWTDTMGIVVPVSTIFGESFLIYVWTNRTKIFDLILFKKNGNGTGDSK
jgi:hypothetical protein